MHFSGTVWRPPYEAWSVLIQVTMGCTHHKCKFCTLYNNLPFKFKISPVNEVEEDLKEASRYMPKARRIFLVGANPFALSSEKLSCISALSKQYFQYLDSIGCFARVTDIAAKSDDELKQLQVCGYNRITIGVETGDDTALKFMNKGYTSYDIVRQLKRLDDIGIEYNIFYLTGISGMGNGQTGAKASAQIFNMLNPKIIGCSMLTIYPDSELYKEIEDGNWHEESETEKIDELKTLIECLTIKTHFAALGASNIVNIQGSLPSEKNILINGLNKILDTFSENEMKVYRDNLPHL